MPLTNLLRHMVKYSPYYVFCVVFLCMSYINGRLGSGGIVGFLIKFTPSWPHIDSLARAVVAYRNKPSIIGSSIPTIIRFDTTLSLYGYNIHLPIRTFTNLAKSLFGGKKNLQFSHDRVVVIVDARVFKIYSK